MKTSLLMLVLLAGGHALAAPNTVTLSVPAMSCASCPVTIKVALSRVPGVSSVKSDLGKRQTTVAYDDARADLAALAKAMAEAGFPSTPVETGK